VRADFIRHWLTGDGVRLERAAIPAADGDAVVIQHEVNAIKGEHGIRAFDVVKVLENRAGRQAAALGAEVPLQVADPQHQLGNRGGARVELQAEELVRVDGQAFGFEQRLRLAQVVQLIEHFAFQALHVFQRDVEKIAAAAGRVEHAQAHRRW
jgi:hypothetical protein